MNSYVTEVSICLTLDSTWGLFPSYQATFLRKKRHFVPLKKHKHQYFSIVHIMTQKFSWSSELSEEHSEGILGVGIVAHIHKVSIWKPAVFLIMGRNP